MPLKTRTFTGSARPSEMAGMTANVDAGVNEFLATIDGNLVGDVKTALSPVVGHPEWPAVVVYVVTVIYLEA